MARRAVLALALVSACSLRNLDDLTQSSTDGASAVEAATDASIGVDAGATDHGTAHPDGEADSGLVIADGDADAADAAIAPDSGTCSDGYADNDETDVDCGGSCPPCAVGQKCELATDCATNFCAAGFCYLRCDDGVQDGDETDVDCGGSLCPPCPPTKKCRPAADDCTSHFCDTDGICKCPGGFVQVIEAQYQKPYCIQSLEVTKDAYGKFLGMQPGNGTYLPPWTRKACRFDTSLIPNFWPPPTAERPYPAVDVDWCQATAYCEYSGLRLCGRIGGGMLGFDTTATASVSQWFNACSEGGLRDYPYVLGSTVTSYNPAACNGADFYAPPMLPSAAPADPAFPAGDQRLRMCEGGYAGLFMMSGNVWEWEEACDGNGSCAIRGGAYDSPAALLACSASMVVGISTRDQNIGFRCCTRF